MNLYQAEQNGKTYFGVGKDEKSFVQSIRDKANRGEIEPTFAFLDFDVKEITVDGYDLILRKRGSRKETDQEA